MKKLIDITTTATLRPEILEKTFSSFWQNIFSQHDYDYRLIINIDPIGDYSCLSEDVLDVAESFFSDIVYNCPDSHSFPKAVKWVWSNSTSDYVFHLEDMWLAMTSVNLSHLVHILDNYPHIGCVNLYKYVLSDGAPEPNFYQYNTKQDKRLFLQIRDPLLSPGLYRGDFVRKISKKMNDNDNPELQMWGDKKVPNDSNGSKKVRKCLSAYDYSLYVGNWKLPFWKCAIPTVNMQQGRMWKRDHGFYKETHFTPWKRQKVLESEKK